MSHGLDSTTLGLLERLGTATLYEAQGQQGALPPALRPVWAGAFLAGPAYTVDTRSGDNLALHHAVVLAHPGDVIVADCGGYLESGVWGDVLTNAAQHRGIAGLVVEGAVRDSDRIRDLGFPIFSRGLSIGGTSKEDEGTHQQTLLWDGAAIEPGDIVVGDADGVVVIQQAEFETVLEAALAREEKEAQMIKEIQEGKTTIELLRLSAPEVRAKR